MATVIDVARYVLGSVGQVTSMKLQKLVFYSQAWSLAWDDEPLFGEYFQAWANGPVCPELFKEHKGYFRLSADFFGKYVDGVLSSEQIDTIDIVLKDYADMAPYELSNLTHREYPWINARGNTPPGMPCENIIEKKLCAIITQGLHRTHEQENR